MGQWIACLLLRLPSRWFSPGRWLGHTCIPCPILYPARDIRLSKVNKHWQVGKYRHHTGKIISMYTLRSVSLQLGEGRKKKVLPRLLGLYVGVKSSHPSTLTPPEGQISTLTISGSRRGASLECRVDKRFFGTHSLFLAVNRNTSCFSPLITCKRYLMMF